MTIFQVNKQEFLCHGKVLEDGYDNHVQVNIDGKNEKYSFVPSNDSVHIFTKVRNNEINSVFINTLLPQPLFSSFFWLLQLVLMWIS